MRGGRGEGEAPWCDGQENTVPQRPAAAAGAAGGAGYGVRSTDASGVQWPPPMEHSLLLATALSHRQLLPGART